MSNLIRVAGMVNDSIVDGPGLRFTLFMQGCPLKCEGCHNPQTQPFEGGTFYSIEDILNKIKSNPLLDGVTFSGGEPLCQAENLIPLAKEIKNLGLHLAIYTGFVFEQLFCNSSYEKMLELLSYADVLIDGPFVLKERDPELKFKGSTNQRVIDVKQSLLQRVAILETSEKWN